MIEKLMESTGLSGLFLIEIVRDGKIVDKRMIKNRLTDLYINTIVNTLVGTAADFEIKYIAVGTSNKVIDDADTKLTAEIYRITPSSAPVLIETGIIKTEFILAKATAVAQLEEIGIFCGSGASGSVDTGKMLNRILWSYDKTIADEIYITRYDKAQRG